MTDDVLQPESAPAAPLRRFSHEAMACTFEAALACDDARYARQAACAAFDEIDRLERELSRYIPTSDVSRINALQPGENLHIGIDAFECLRLAEQICRDTGGAFDVTYASKPVGPVESSPVGPVESHPVEPVESHPVGPVFNRSSSGLVFNRSSSDDASRALLEIDPAHRRVRVRAAGVLVDLGGIGKGFAVDRALEILREWGIDAGLLHSGQSSLLAFGSPGDDKPWRIALRDPLDHSKVHGHVELKNAALSGSGRKLHGDHIIDPRTRRPAVAKVAAWSVAPSAALADALSTAFMIMSPDEIDAYCRGHESVAALVATMENDALRWQSWGNTKWLIAGA